MHKAEILKFYKEAIKKLDATIKKTNKRDPKLHTLYTQRRDLVDRLERYEALHSKDLPHIKKDYGTW